MLDVLAKLATPWWKSIVGAAAGVFTYLFPNVTKDMFYGILALVIIDLVTGVLAAIAGRTAVTSYGIKRTLFKMTAYFSVLAVMSIVPRHVPGLAGAEAFSIGVAIGIIILTESKSILENVRRMGFDLPFNIEPAIRKKLGELSKTNSGVEPD